MSFLKVFDVRDNRVTDLPLRVINSFPKPGINFVDIAPVLASATHLSGLLQSLSFAAQAFKPFSHIVALDARGFLFASSLATLHNAGVLMARKAGKLPGPSVRTTYDLEYGSATLELQTGLLPTRSRVLLLDDVLATGGTISAAYDLVREAGADPVGALFPFELEGLGGRDRLHEHAHSDFRVSSIYRLDLA